MMPLKLTSTGKFKAEIERRKRELGGKKITAKLIIAPGNDWWYYHEFGTASRSESGGSAYSIQPVNGNGLAWPDRDNPSQKFFVPAVGPPHTALHPGVEPTAMVRRVLDDIRAHTAQTVSDAIQQSDSTAESVQVAVAGAMEYAKETITASIEDALPGTREDGKLAGRSAAQVFSDECAVEISE